MAKRGTKNDSRNRRAFPSSAEVISALPLAQVRLLASRAERVSVSSRSVLWEPRQAAAHVLWVRSGVVREEAARVGDGDGLEAVTVRYAARGALVGEDALIAGFYGYRSVVHAEADVLRVPVDLVNEVVRSSPEVLHVLLARATGRARRLSRRLAGVRRPAAARVSEALLELSQVHGVRDSRGTIINIKLTHMDLARWALTSRETASGALNQLKRAGLVLTDGKVVVVVNPDALAVVVQSGSIPR